MKVQAIKDYADKERGKVKKGDQFDVSTERATTLLNARVCEIVSLDDYDYNDELIEANKNAQERIAELEQIALERYERIAELESGGINNMSEYAYMPDAQVAALAKEKGIDGRIKDRKVIIDMLMGKSED